LGGRWGADGGQMGGIITLSKSKVGGQKLIFLHIFFTKNHNFLGFDKSFLKDFALTCLQVESAPLTIEN